MKSLIAIVFLFTTVLSKPSEYISVEHTGISDKPIRTIVIIKDKIFNSKGANISSVNGADTSSVNSKVYNTLKATILIKTKAEYKGIEFGTFKITVKNTNGKILTYNVNRKKSIELFNKLIEVLDKESPNHELSSKLKILIKRIQY